MQKKENMQSETLQQVFEYAHMYLRGHKLTELKSEHVLIGLVGTDNEARHFLTEIGMTTSTGAFSATAAP